MIIIPPSLKSDKSGSRITRIIIQNDTLRVQPAK